MIDALEYLREYLRTLPWLPFVIVTALGIALGYARKGRMSRMWLPWPVVPLAFLALATQVVLTRVSTIDVPVTLAAYLLTYLVAAVCLVLMWRSLGLSGALWLGRFALALLAAGWALNTTVIALNRGIPVSESALERAGVRSDGSKELLQKDIHKDGESTTEARLAFLGDTLPVAPMRAVVSIGDVVFIAGLGGLIAASMAGHAEFGGSKAMNETRPAEPTSPAS